MATTTRTPAKKAPVGKPTGRTSIDYVREAMGDIDKARQSAQGETQAQLDRATDRLRTLATDLRDRAEAELRDFESLLDRAGGRLRVELALRAIRAQDSTEALTELSSEIRKRKAELTK